MAIIVSDTFNRADDPTGLGTADTGQVWTIATGNAGDWQVNNNNALWTWASGHANGRAVIDSGFTDAITKVTLVNPTTGLVEHFATGMGLICRWVDINYYWRLVYYRFSTAANTNLVALERIYAGSATSHITVFVTLAPNDTISVAYCGSNWEIFINDVSQGTYDDSSNPQNYGTLSGLYGTHGSYFSTLNPRWDDFLVTTNGTCTPTYNCTGGACVDPGDGTGTYATLAACLAGCSVAATYDCVNGQCIDPGDGTGTFASLAECAASGCGGLTVETVNFDQGTGSGYYYVAPVVDSGDELRSKTVKSVRVTGKLTNAASEVYGYDVSDVVSTTDLEQGLNSATGQIAITDTTGVAQTPREQVNVPNAVLHTVRIVGDDTGEATRDRIDEIVTEQSEIGVRR